MSSKQVFKIHGMDCAEEITVLKAEIGPMVGGEDRLGFDLLNGKMTISDGATASSEAILQAIARTGMQAEVWEEKGSAPSGRKFARQRLQFRLMMASGILAATAFALHAVHAGGLMQALGSEEIGRAHV